MLEAYRIHVAERAVQGIPPEPLSAEQTAQLVELLKTPKPQNPKTPKPRHSELKLNDYQLL